MPSSIRERMVLNIAACAFFIGIALLSYARDPSWLRPTALFGIVWAFIIITAVIIPFGLHTLRPEAIAIFIVGGIVFVLAGELADLLAIGHMMPPPLRAEKRWIQSAAVLFNVGLLLLVPIFVHDLQQAMEILQIDDFAIAARFALGPERELTQVPHYFQSVTSVGVILALACACVYEGSRADRIVLALCIPGPLVMSVLSFARMPVVSLVVGIAAILALRVKISRRVLLIAVSLTFVLAFVMARLLGKGPDLDVVASPIVGFAQNAGMYFGGGALAFSEVVDQPFRVAEPGLSHTFVTQLLTWFRLVDRLPDSVLEFVSADLGNVYTYYFNYWADAGWIGVIAIAAATGFATNVLYRLAQRGVVLAGVMFGISTQAVLLSGAADQLFFSSVPWLLVIFIIGGLQLGARLVHGTQRSLQRDGVMVTSTLPGATS